MNRAPYVLAIALACLVATLAALAGRTPRPLTVTLDRYAWACARVRPAVPDAGQRDPVLPRAEECVEYRRVGP